MISPRASDRANSPILVLRAHARPVDGPTALRPRKSRLAVSSICIQLKLIVLWTSPPCLSWQMNLDSSSPYLSLCSFSTSRWPVLQTQSWAFQNPWKLFLYWECAGCASKASELFLLISLGRPSWLSVNPVCRIIKN